MNISYDYDELLEELKSDIAEGLIEESLFIVRGPEQLGYKPIVDYFFGIEEVDELAELAKTKAVIKEMEEMNKFF